MAKGRSYRHRKAQRDAVKEGAYRCRKCGLVNDDAQGHHIIEYHIGGAADTHIIIPLCRACHIEYHKKNPGVRIYRL
ncbi:HNH endonuclease signature motif containing protein [Microbulbifer thermotolerans]|uniref:HNH endonuclease signature motif containing protein n=1 Tax=Microbulbifer thermotolerans TaxID=252514 RepID=UPI0034619C64